MVRLGLTIWVVGVLVGLAGAVPGITNDELNLEISKLKLLHRTLPNSFDKFEFIHDTYRPREDWFLDASEAAEADIVAPMVYNEVMELLQGHTKSKLKSSLQKARFATEATGDPIDKKFFFNVFLFPGVMGTGIEIQDVNGVCDFGKGKWGKAWLNPWSGCHLSALHLVNKNGKGLNPPGRSGRPSGGWDSHNAVHRLIDEDEVGSSKSIYMEPLMKQFEHLGFAKGDTLHVAPFDWRFAPHSTVQDHYFKQLKERTENAYKKNGKKSWYFTHSLGGIMVMEFLSRMEKTDGEEKTEAWVRKYIQGIAMVASPFGGSTTTLPHLLGGSDMCFPIYGRHSLLKVARTLESLPALSPSPKDGERLVEENEVVVQLQRKSQIRGKNEELKEYRMKDLADLVMSSWKTYGPQRNSKHEWKKMWDANLGKNPGLHPPKVMANYVVPVHMFFASQRKTPLQYRYTFRSNTKIDKLSSGDLLDELEGPYDVTKWSQGDSVVLLKSAMWFMKWKDKHGRPVKTQRLYDEGKDSPPKTTRMKPGRIYYRHVTKDDPQLGRNANDDEHEKMFSLNARLMMQLIKLAMDLPEPGQQQQTPASTSSGSTTSVGTMQPVKPPKKNFVLHLKKLTCVDTQEWGEDEVVVKIYPDDMVNRNKPIRFPLQPVNEDKDEYYYKMKKGDVVDINFKIPFKNMVKVEIIEDDPFVDDRFGSYFIMSDSKFNKLTFSKKVSLTFEIL